MEGLARFVRQRYLAVADPRKAAEMAAYMKTDMPFYGVQAPMRENVTKELLVRFPIDSRTRYKQAVLTLWEQPHREEKYTAIAVARSYPGFITMASLPLYKRLIQEGAWWDLVDDVAIHLAGHLLLHQRKSMKPEVEKWITHSNLWMRRSALLCHMSHKDQTDEKQLFRHCLKVAGENEFFIRKAIGWALREYAKTSPTAVKAFLRKNEKRLSPLSFREAAKHLKLKAA
ncbi:MAG: DNA alkylation repair protein [Planctomycetota bacterium]|jgi:3-methyladenine DNA glycosylase AlkD